MTKKLSLVEIEYICNMFFNLSKFQFVLDCNKNILLEFKSKNDSHSLYTSKIEQLHMLFREMIHIIPHLQNSRISRALYFNSHKERLYGERYCYYWALDTCKFFYK